MRSLVQKYGVAAVLLASVAAYLCVTYLSPVQRFAAAAFRASGESSLYDASVRFFAFFGEPSARQVDHNVDLAILAVSLPVVVLLGALSRLHAVSRPPRDPETKQRHSGLGWRLIVMRVVAPLLILLSLALGSWAWLSVVRYGAQGDQLTTQAHLELSAYLQHPTRGRWALRQRAYELRSIAGREQAVFTFGSDTPVKELRVSLARAEDATLEFVFVDAHLPPLRVPERECASVSGTLGFRRKPLATRSGLVPDGELHISCPAHALEVHAHVVPGYSERQARQFAATTMVRHANELAIVAGFLLFAALVLGVHGFSARYDDRKADGAAEWMAKLIPMIALGGLGLFAFIRVSTASDRDAVVDLTPDYVAGCFHAHHRLLGTWQGVPERCLASRSADFQGVLFAFPSGGEVRELRLDTAREGHYVAEFRFFDSNRAPVFIQERDCTQFLVPLHLATYRMNARPIDRAYGELHLSCPKYGLEAHATYRGCEP